jgi:hypothetical protein
VRVPQLRRIVAVAALGAALFVGYAATPAHAAPSQAVDPKDAVAAITKDVDQVSAATAAGYATASAEAGAPASPQVTTLSLSCWTWTVGVKGTNIFGSTLWKYFQEIYWCRDGYRVWYPSVIRRWGETYWPGWSYKGVISRWSYGGGGYTYWTVGSQGHFCLISYFDCVQDKYPWVEQTVRGNGYNTWRYGG